MSTSNEFYLLGTDSFTLDNGQVLSIECNNKIKSATLLDLDRNFKFKVYVLVDECDFKINQEGTKIFIQCSYQEVDN